MDVGLEMKLNWLFSVLRRIGNIPAIKRRWNEIGELVDFCLSFNLVISGTTFQHLDIHKLKWKSPDDITINQIDHIMINKKWRRIHRRISEDNIRVIRVVDANSDLYPLRAMVKLKLSEKHLASKQQTESWHPKTEFSWLNKMAHTGQKEFNTVYPTLLWVPTICMSQPPENIYWEWKFSRF